MVVHLEEGTTEAKGQTTFSNLRSIFNTTRFSFYRVTDRIAMSTCVATQNFRLLENAKP